MGVQVHDGTVAAGPIHWQTARLPPLIHLIDRQAFLLFSMFSYYTVDIGLFIYFFAFYSPPDRPGFLCSF